jgi:hypothetical protein
MNKLSPLNQSCIPQESSQADQPQEACKQSPPSPKCPKCGSEVAVFRFKYSTDYACKNLGCNFASNRNLKRSRAK